MDQNAVDTEFWRIVNAGWIRTVVIGTKTTPTRKGWTPTPEGRR